MYPESVIQIDHLTKVYKLYDKPVDRLKEAFHPFKKQYHRDFYALEDVSFSVNKGETIGVVGKNGSGKSTLLQVITGVLTPTSGNVRVTGKVSALLELGAGFNPELSGRENVYFQSSLLGFSQKETDAKIDEILSFADVGDFISQPVKTYSSGMYVRLAFAVAINVDPDILIIDEALSVGDFRFRQKCLRKIEQFREDGKTIFFVSHDHGSVINFCTKAVWLLDGKVRELGNPIDVCKNYISYMSYGDTVADSSEQVRCSRGKKSDNDVVDKVKEKEIEWVDVSSCSSFGEGGAEITNVSFYFPENFQSIHVFSGGCRVVFSIMLRVINDIENPIVGFHLVTAKGFHLLGLNSSILGRDLGRFVAGQTKIVSFEFDFPLLKNDSYSFSPAVADGNQEDHVQHHWIHDAYVVSIANDDMAAKIGNQIVLKENINIVVS